MSEDVHAGDPDARKADLHRPGTQAIVQCPGFRCLAYCDSKGVWHDAKSRAVLPDVLQILQVIASG